MRRFPCIAAAAVSLLVGASAHAQGTGRSMDLDPSARSSAMGEASGAVFWEETNRWANPALLGSQHGLTYEWGRARLVPALAPDVHYTTNEVLLGGGGIGVAFSGKPGIGGRHLSYGSSEGVDDQGNPTGVFDTYELIDAWSLGLCVARLTETIAALTGHEPTAVSRYADVSVGVTGKHLEMEFAPGFEGETDAMDLGFLVRFSPTEFAPGIRDVFGLDVAYGFSDLSFESDPVFGTEVSEHERSGFTARLRLDHPGMAEDMGWFLRGLRPLVSVGYVREHAEIGIDEDTYETDGDGWEITLANVLSVRSGHYEDLDGGIDGDTRGWGVNLPLGKVAGLRYDEGKRPQAQNSNLRDVKVRNASAWIDPLWLWRAFRLRGSI
jgi:hypothetical protein